MELLDAVVRNGVPSASVATYGAELQALLKVFFDFESTNPLLLSLKIRSLRCFSSFYRVAPQLLTPVLERLLVMVLFRGPAEGELSHAQLSKLTLRVRKEACDSFQRLCADMPDILVGKLGPISSHVSETLIKVWSTRVRWLTHLLITLSHRETLLLPKKRFCAMRS